MLLKFKRKCKTGFRDHLVYASAWNWKYYAAFLEDIIFRFLWTLQAVHVPYVSPTSLMFAEVFR